MCIVHLPTQMSLLFSEWEENAVWVIRQNGLDLYKRLSYSDFAPQSKVSPIGPSKKKWHSETWNLNRKSAGGSSHFWGNGDVKDVGIYEAGTV